MEEVKIGIIGVGNMGSVHLGFFRDGIIKHARVTAVADTDKLKLARVARFYKCEQYDSGEELIDKSDVDAVIIATPHYCHPALAIRAFKRGLHVLSEKPTGVYANQVREMNAAALSSGKLFSVMFNQRANPLHAAVKSAIESGKIGQVKRLNWVVTNWYRTQSYYDSGSWRATWAGEGGGVLINQALHQLDLLQWFVGMPSAVRAFCGFGKWHDIEVEDEVTAYMEFPCGATGVFVTSTGEPHGINRLEIAGTLGTLTYEGGEVTLTQFGTDERVFCANSTGAFDQPSVKTVVIARQEGAFDKHADVLRNFVEAIRGTETLAISGEEGIKSVELVNAMLLSAWKDRAVSLPVDGDEYLTELSARAKNGRRKSPVNGVVIDNRNSFGGF